MPPSTLLPAGGRKVVGVGPAEIAAMATPFQWTTALSPGAADVPAGPNARTATNASIAARPVVIPIRLPARLWFEPVLVRLIRSSPLR
jgi:hypothetical protein